jgi:hypothetical protein
MTAYFPHEQRVVDELADLRERLQKLTVFTLNSEVYYALPDADKLLLLTQRAQMAALGYTLEARINRFPRSGN